MFAVCVKHTLSCGPVILFHHDCPCGSDTFISTSILKRNDLAATAVIRNVKPGATIKLLNVDSRCKAVDCLLKFRVAFPISSGFGFGRRRWGLHNCGCIGRIYVTRSRLVRHGVTLATTLVRKLDLLSVTKGHDREVLRDLGVSPVPLDGDSVLYTRLSHKLIQLELTSCEEIGPDVLTELSALDVQNMTFDPFFCTSCNSLG